LVKAVGHVFQAHRRPLQAEEGGQERAENQETLPSAGYIDCLKYCLEARGEKAPKALMMGLSGESFRLCYNRNDPQRGASVVSFNPLRAACAALGYDCQITYDRDLEAAADSLAARARSQPVVIHCWEGWRVVAGVDPQAQAFVIRFHDGSHRTWTRQELREKWLMEPGLLELGLTGYYQFFLGEKRREPDKREAAVGSLRRGVRLLTRSRPVDGCMVGLAAYEAMARDLVRRRNPRAPGGYPSLSPSLGQAMVSRKAAAKYLELLENQFQQKEEREHLRKAAKGYREAATVLERLPEPSPGSPWQRRRVARGVKRLKKMEEEAAEELRKVIECAERRQTSD